MVFNEFSGSIFTQYFSLIGNVKVVLIGLNPNSSFGETSNLGLVFNGFGLVVFGEEGVVLMCSL